MVKKSLLILLFGCFFVCSLFARGYSAHESLKLHEGWEFSKAGTDEWRKAVVPGTVHQDLIAHGLLPDPFYGMNEDKVQWVENEDWIYRTSFNVTDEQLARDEASLVFEGLDTYADVYLNGSLLLKSDNMFVGYRIPVKDVLRKDGNKLMIRFRSPINETMPQWETDGFNYPADNDHSDKRMSVYSRKAPYSYGWDWGIRLVTSGIWRPVSLEFYDVACLNDFYVRQLSVSESEADIENRIELDGVCDEKKTVEVSVTATFGNEVVKEVRTVEIVPGENSVMIPMKIVNPHLWMPNGWGEPCLYSFVASVKADGVEIAKKEHKIGLRDVKVVKEKDKDGESFYFMVNGKPLFAKGSNMIPNDALLPRVTSERYERLMEDVKSSNMNMIRVWGGGIYEDDAFYDAADKNGILIWQDFLFACTTYPHDPTFLKRVSQEAEYNIKRLRNHASLAMWCGNNEIYEGMRYWGWKDKYSEEIFNEMKEGYDAIFHKLLPEMVKTYDPDRFYMHGSPYEANWGRPESWKIADSHNWGTWYGQKPFESLDKEIPRFMSEYGFQAFPEMKTIRTFASPEDYALESDVMNAHQKSTIGNFLIKKTMALYYKVPEKFEDLVYAGLVLQGQGMRHGMEAHRRNRPYCMGSLPWQLNDSWPVVSWSSIDYYGNWKAMQYQTKRAFAPVLVDAIKEGDDICYYIMSDRLDDLNVTLSLDLMNFDGKILRKFKKDGVLKANTSVLFHKEKEIDALDGNNPANTMVRMIVKSDKGDILSDELFYFAYPKDQMLPNSPVKYKVKYKEKEEVCELTLKAEKLARDVFIEVPVQGARFTDNFFDLLPGQKKTVVISSPEGYSLKDMEIKIHQLSDIQ